MSRHNTAKESVARYWNQASCGTEFIEEIKHSREYFEAIEQFRYTIEPEIFAFAQFTRFHGKKVLEVGVGAGTDFLQWVRAGAQAYGVDLTHEAVTNVLHRLATYNVAACDVQVADAEKLNFADNNFDLVYSWGVIHHSPDPVQCLREIVRVTKPGGSIKIMVYNRRSLFAFYQYLQHGLLRGKPFASMKKILAQHQESPGTQAYTFKEIKNILKDFPVRINKLQASTTSHDLLYYKKSKFIKACAYIAACLSGWDRRGWFMTLDLTKRED
ncbi:class I SAM-dependent methyltransferase [Candidatus Babeliales bacterium]|nr:class I SAM-dependent methyltransferase [Candidatus Babeliales bacterium]